MHGNAQSWAISAKRFEMMIQVVEPKELIGRIVPERRPLAFPENATRNDAVDERLVALALTVCLMIVISFGALLAYALEVALDCV